MNPVYEKLMTCLKSVQEKVSFQPEVALILGSGLGDYADEIRVEQTVDYNTIEGFPVSTVAGEPMADSSNPGRLLLRYLPPGPKRAQEKRPRLSPRPSRKSAGRGSPLTAVRSLPLTAIM